MIELIRRRERLKWSRVIEIADQVLNARAAAHQSERQIIHRDVRPANVLVTDEDDDAFVKWQYFRWDADEGGFLGTGPSAESDQPTFQISRVAMDGHVRQLVTSEHEWLSHVASSPGGEMLGWTRTKRSCVPWVIRLE